MLIKGYSDFATAIPEPSRRITSPSFDGARIWTASFRLDTDVSHLFPYINAVIEDAVYYEGSECIHFSLEDYQCWLHPDIGGARFFEDNGQAREFVERLIAFLNDLDSKTDSIRPNHERFRPTSALEILKILPRTNCQECGFLTCMAFAVALSRGKTIPEQCIGFQDPLSERAVYPVLDDEGNVTSTVEIKIDTSKMRLDIEQQRENIRLLKESLARMEEERGSDPPEDTITETAFGLTEREIAVLSLVADGLTNIEISNSLFISPHTVKSHVIHIFNKLGVNDRTQAAVLATKHGII